MSVAILKFFGFFLMLFIAVFAVKLWGGATELEKEIEAEHRDIREDETRGV